MHINLDDAYAETIQSILTLNRTLRKYSKKVHSEGISGRQLAALKYLAETGEHTAGEIARYLYVSESSMSEQLRKLKQKGYISKLRNEEDNRVVTVTITSEGKKVVKNMPAGGILLLRERLRELDVRELKSIGRSVAKLNTLMETE